MERLIKILVLVIFSNYSFGQNNSNSKKFKDTIVFSYNDIIYNNITKDTVKRIIQDQLKLFKKNKKLFNDINNLISINYEYEDLKFSTIPRFRLFKDGYKLYNCETNIEQFICFEEHYKYHYSEIIYKDSILATIEIPAYYFEYDRIMNPEKNKLSYTEDYEYFLKKLFRSFPKEKKSNDNFNFYIYGLRCVLFELDMNTGLLYASFDSLCFYNNYDGENRLLANDFLRKYVGPEIIKELCLGNYTEVEEMIDKKNYKFCEDFKPLKQVYLKLK